MYWPRCGGSCGNRASCDIVEKPDVSVRCRQGCDRRSYGICPRQLKGKKVQKSREHRGCREHPRLTWPVAQPGWSLGTLLVVSRPGLKSCIDGHAPIDAQSEAPEDITHRGAE